MDKLEKPKWTEFDGTSSELEMSELLYGLVRMLKPKLLVETGTYKGFTTAWLADAIKENNYGEFISCDINEEYITLAQKYLSSLELSKFVELRCISSYLVEELKEADFIYSDSDYQCRAKEIELAKKGCIIVIHDTTLESWKRYSPTSKYLGDTLATYDGLTFDVSRGFSIIRK